MIDPSLQIWGWEIPVYLYLGGLVAGIMIISGYFLFSGRYRDSSVCSCFISPLLGLGLLSLGMLALFLDLEHKLHTWRLYTTFEIASPMSWGAWILILVYPVLLASMIIRLPESLKTRQGKIYSWLTRLSRVMNSLPMLVKNVGILNMLVGGTLGMYTGVLLSALGARPLWSSSILWLLFLVSGLSSAAALVHMITRDPGERVLLAKADNGFLTFELFVMAIFIVSLTSTSAAHLQAASLLLSGSYAPAFWVFVVALGILIPLLIQFLAVNRKIKHTSLAPILVLFGGLMLRLVIVYAGQYSHWLGSPHGNSISLF